VTLASSDCRARPPDTSWTLAFDDEVSSDLSDTSKWTVGSLSFGGLTGSTHYHSRQYGSYILPENAQIHDGALDLTANNIPVTDRDVPSIGTIPCTEGMVHTKNKFSRTGGYFETCAKFPNGKGLWPAFWLAAQNGNWPPEMDIAEWFGHHRLARLRHVVDDYRRLPPRRSFPTRSRSTTSPCTPPRHNSRPIRHRDHGLRCNVRSHG
jgi:beta-glucanase (GH16 family)